MRVLCRRQAGTVHCGFCGIRGCYGGLPNQLAARGTNQTQVVSLEFSFLKNKMVDLILRPRILAVVPKTFPDHGYLNPYGKSPNRASCSFRPFQSLQESREMEL